MFLIGAASEPFRFGGGIGMIYNLNLTDEEHREVKATAALMGVSMSEWWRRARRAYLVTSNASVKDAAAKIAKTKVGQPPPGPLGAI